MEETVDRDFPLKRKGEPMTYANRGHDKGRDLKQFMFHPPVAVEHE